MASDVDASCENDPNFAVICAFFEKFGENCGLGPIDFSELQSMLENTEEVPPPLANLLIKLMRKVRKTVKPEKWEKALVGLCHNFSSKDAWEIERFGFKKAKLSSKVRALKELLEMQFDFNVKFKGEINKLTATELRSQPLGRDKSGHAYWFHSDHNFQIRVYKEDLDDETWTLIAKDRESLVSLIAKLNDGEVKCSSDSAVNEDSNSLSEKLIIDTGQIDSDSATGKEKSTEDDVEQIPKKMKIEDDAHEEKVLKIHLTDIQKSPRKQDCDKLEKANENEEVKEEEKMEEKMEEHESKKTEKDDSKKDQETYESKKAKKEDSKKDETSEKSPIVGDTIEEDTMYVQGEGSGKESEAGNDEKATALDESPIVGEVIEEEIMHIRGEGSGEDCETGNDEKASVNETQSGDVTHSLNSSSTENSIRDDGVDEVNKGENVPKIKLDEVDSGAKMSPAKVESEATPEKKPTFFFGSPQKETSVTTSLTMEFGQKADQTDKSPSDIVEKETSHNSLEENQKNRDDIGNESEVNQKKTTSKADDANQNKKVLGKNDDNNPKKDEPPDKEDSKKLAVVEELCVKKHAYVCGEETKEENKEKQEVKKDAVCSKSSKSENCKLDAEKPETPDKEVKSKESTDRTNIDETKSLETKPDDKCKLEKNKSESDVESAIEDDSKTDSNKRKSKDFQRKADGDKSEQDSNMSKPEKTESNLNDESTIKSDKSNEDKNKSDEISTPEKTNARPGMALRAVRTKRAVAQSKSKEKPSLEETPAKDEKIVDTEIVYVKSRRGKKEREVTPPTKTKNVKKPKLLVKDKNKKEDKVDSDNASVTSESKAGKGSMASADSSRVSTPVSMPDSIITIPEITEVTSVEEPPVLEKDPLGCSDDDQDDETDPAPNTQASLQNFSFDYDDTAATPAIPVIPTTRSLRKRGREASPVGPVVDKQQGGKKMKLKGKRRFNTKLRRSIEQQKQQLQQPSSSDEAVAVSSDEAPKPPKEIPPKKKRGRKKKSEAVIEVDDDSSNQAPTTKVKKEKKPNARMLEGLGIVDLDAVQNETLGVRQSRRLAQIKIKESLDVKKPEPKSKTPIKEEKSKKKSKEIVVPEKKKHSKKAATPEPKVLEPEPSGRRRKKRSVDPSKLFDQSRPWRSSSESSEEEEEAVEEEEEEEIEEKLEFNAKSDHEFSPESDLESGEEYQAPKRARTAKRKEDSAEEEDEEDFPCQKCGKSDHPEWILLCDKCENGWHCSCLRPPLLSIPEGDWFCPPCEHIKLVENLQQKLKEYDKNIEKKNLEDRRKERLAYVGISLNNVLPPSKDQEKREKRKKKRHTSESGSSGSGDEDEDDAESETDSDEPVYQLRQRRQARSYKFNEYDDLINSAIQDQLGEPVVRPPSPVCGRGKDMATIVKAEQEERKENDVFKDLAEPKKDSENGSEGDEENKKSKPSVKPPVKKPRKKPRKMTALDVSSEDDDERDEDFIGDVSMSSEDEDVDEEDSDEDSDDIARRRRNLRPVRRSTRTRASKIDKDFIDDDEDDSDRAPRKKKKKHYFSDEESSESDGSWGRRRKKGSSKKKKSKKKNSILDELSDLEVPKRKKKRRIVYGGLTSSEEELGRGRRTRGKKTTYVEALGSETEDEVQKRNPRKIESDDEDFVANEEEDEEEAQDEDEPEPEDEDEEEEEDRKNDTEERRRLMVPKIYIKKPAAGVVKETDKSKKVNSEVNKPEDKTDIEQNGKEPEADKNNEPKEKPAVETKSEEKKSVPTATNNSGRVRIKVVPRKENVSGKPTNLQEINKQSEKPKEVDLNKKTEKDSTNTHLTVAGNQLDSEKKKSVGVEKINMKKVLSSLDKAGIELTKMPASQPLQKAATAKPPPQSRPIRHEPIVSNVNALLKNDDSNDELSEPPGVALPVFDEVTITKKEAPRRRIKIRPKKSLEETVAHLGSAISIKPAAPKPADQSTTTSTCKIEIAAPPQPFSQTAPAPSIITRMLQTPSGTQEAKDTPDKDTVASSAEPAPKPDYSVIGKIRPKQFATMPLEDDDDEPPVPPPVRQRKLGPTVDSQEHFVQNGGRPGGVPPPPQYHHRLPPTHPPPPMNHYPPHQPPPHEPACGPSGTPPPRTHHNVAPPPQGYHKDPPQAYHKEPPPPPPQHVAGSPAKGMEGYGRTQQNRYNNPGGGPAYPLRPPVHMPHPPSYPSPQPPAAAQTEPPAPQPPPPQYYGNYPPPPVVEATEEPPYQNHPPYQEGYGAEVAPPPVQEPPADNSKSYDAEEAGGEFGGLVSYFSSQQEDDLDS